MKLLLLLPCLALFLVACGGGSSGDRVLHFTGRDETEANFRDRVRSTKTDAPADFVQACAALQGMSPTQAAAALRPDEDDTDESALPKGSTAKPNQKANADDLLRAAEIVMDECKR